MGSLRGLLSAETNAELRTGSKIARYRDRNRAECMQEFLGGSNFASATGTLVEVLIKPGLVGVRESFDKRLRKEFLRADVKVFSHTEPSGNADFNATSPR